MSENVDLELNLDDDVVNDLVKIYIRNTVSEPSLELFEMVLEDGDLPEAMVKAIINEAILHVVKMGMAMEQNASYSPEMIEAYEKLKKETRRSDED